MSTNKHRIGPLFWKWSVVFYDNSFPKFNFTLPVYNALYIDNPFSGLHGFPNFLITSAIVQLVSCFKPFISDELPQLIFKLPYKEIVKGSLIICFTANGKLMIIAFQAAEFEPLSSLSIHTHPPPHDSHQ